ncbi:glycoside hydrolase family 18 protein [Victivallis sp. Marseille-Q1083]|uniref:glycoside hydrolase family 18 protein n=1 Tax=Victivallis sp. Marseille-Q1083 TaxID=2717288 RepID=UPI001588C03E|nr:glycoside hydrolase family 18 protein [Victivallis sp. Marseille-Q1083]
MQKITLSLGGMLLLLLAGCTTSPDGRLEPLLGGYYDGHYPLERIDPAYDLYFNAFLIADADGNLLLTADREPDPALAAHAGKQGKRALISLGGTTPFGCFTGTEQEIDAYVAQVIDYVEKNGYDGVDVDWEHPNTEPLGKQWSATIKALRTALDELGRRNGRHYLLTTALPPGDWSLKYNDFAVMRDCLDYVNVMCYDLGWGTSNYHAPRFANPADPARVSSVDQLTYLENVVGMPRSKLIIGLPFYGNYFRDTERFVEVPDENWRQITYREALDYSEDWQREYEPESCGVWAFGPDRREFVIYDSPQSIYDKTTYYLENGYGGVFCWAMNRDLLADGSQPLTQAMVQARRDFLNRNE